MRFANRFTQPLNQWKAVFSRIAAGLIAGGMGFTQAAPAVGQTYRDLEGHWVQSCVDQLSQQQIVSGYPDNTFRPAAVISRTEYAALINQAFPEVQPEREAVQFADVPVGYWGQAAIQTAYQRGFLSGFPDQTFRPAASLSRVEAFVALVSGLGYSLPTSPQALLNLTFVDADDIPDYAVAQIAAAVQQGFLIAPPAAIADPLMNANGLATRAQVAAALCEIKFENAGIPATYVAQPATEPPAAPDIALAATCINETAGYSVRYPEDWQTNDGDVTQVCQAFDPSEITLPERAESFDEAVLIRVDAIAFNRIIANENIAERIISQRFITIAGQQALVSEGESTGQGLLPAGIRSYRYVVDWGDRILVGSTYDIATQQYERNKQVLAAMMNSLQRLP